ncbi:hypothetical protein ASE31_10490 [Acidovorax sp. Root217]|nr:hypothetical protein ASE31_10490 [Acidovorax sp. Root217]
MIVRVEHSPIFKYLEQFGIGRSCLMEVVAQRLHSLPRPFQIPCDQLHSDTLHAVTVTCGYQMVECFHCTLDVEVRGSAASPQLV